MANIQKELYEKRKIQNLCPRCGKQNNDNKYIYCIRCRNKIITKPRTKKEERIKKGFCIWCDTPVKPGYKICEEHYQMNCEKAKKSDRTYVRNEINSYFKHV